MDGNDENGGKGPVTGTGHPVGWDVLSASDEASSVMSCLTAWR